MRYNPPAPAPADRPRCPGCGCRLAPLYNDVTEKVTLPGVQHAPQNYGRELVATGGYSWRTVERQWLGRYHGYGLFHSLRCAKDFANRVVALARSAHAPPAVRAAWLELIHKAKEHPK